MQRTILLTSLALIEVCYCLWNNALIAFQMRTNEKTMMANTAMKKSSGFNGLNNANPATAGVRKSSNRNNNAKPAKTARKNAFIMYPPFISSICPGKSGCVGQSLSSL